MEKCFICKGKLKKKNHYLCKHCYEEVLNSYNELIDSNEDLEKFIIDKLDKYDEDKEGKVRYICALWYMLEEYDCDDLINFLFENKIVLQNLNTLKDIIQEKNKEIKQLNNIIKELTSAELVINKKYKNKSIPCEDGHIVKSNAELRIDQFLYKNGILHAYEKTITLKDGSQIHPDFYIPEIDVYIEYHGIKGSSWYNRMNQYKDNIYKIEQITVIVIKKEQEEQIEKILPVLLNQNGLNKTFK